jgi:hypothetical protein
MRILLLLVALCGCTGQPENCKVTGEQGEQIAGRAYAPPRTIYSCDGKIVYKPKEIK